MNSDRNIENLLATLGNAREAGVFSAARPGFPWRADSTRKAASNARRLSWVRVAAPLAAAAAVAVVFVVPNFMKSRQVQEIARNLPVGAASESAGQMADTERATSNAATFDCDYNGDGRIDGLDIQAFVNHLKEMHGDPSRQAEYLQRCLLGS